MQSQDATIFEIANSLDPAPIPAVNSSVKWVAIQPMVTLKRLDSLVELAQA
ncbi:MAG: hypothetical protein R2865_01030 [Deinococcales bacterium]